MEYINYIVPPSGTPLHFQVQTTGANETFTLPKRSNGSYSYDVDWGDGQIDAGITTFGDARKTHTYAVAGTHDIYITGEYSKIYVQLYADKDKIIRVGGGSAATKLDAVNMFGCHGLIEIESDFYMSNVIDLQRGLSNCINLPAIPTGLDTSKVRFWIDTFDGWAADMPLLTAIPTMDYSSATHINGTFKRCVNMISFNDDISFGNQHSGTFERSGIVTFSSAPFTPGLAADNPSSVAVGFARMFWQSNLEDFPANMFDAIVTPNLNEAFLQTNLTDQSTENILSSVITSGVTGGFLGLSAKVFTAVELALVAILQGRGWTVTQG